MVTHRIVGVGRTWELKRWKALTCFSGLLIAAIVFGVYWAAEVKR